MISLQHFSGEELREIAKDTFVASRLLPVFREGGDLEAEYALLVEEWRRVIRPDAQKALRKLLENRLVGEFCEDLPPLDGSNLHKLCNDYNNLFTFLDEFRNGIYPLNPKPVLKEVICEVFFSVDKLSSISEDMRDLLDELVALYEMIEKINTAIKIQFRVDGDEQNVLLLIMNLNNQSLEDIIGVPRKYMYECRYVTSMLDGNILGYLRSRSSYEIVARIIRGKIVSEVRAKNLGIDFFAVSEYILQDYEGGSSYFRGTISPSQEEFHDVGGYNLINHVNELVEGYLRKQNKVFQELGVIPSEQEDFLCA